MFHRQNVLLFVYAKLEKLLEITKPTRGRPKILFSQPLVIYVH